MRKPHEQMLWLLLGVLGGGLILYAGPEQMPTVENPPPIVLGAPQETEKPSRQVLEFAPPDPPPVKAVTFEVAKPPVAPIVVFEPLETSRPKSLNVPGLPLPIASAPASRMPRGNETNAPVSRMPRGDETVPPQVIEAPLPSVTTVEPLPIVTTVEPPLIETVEAPPPIVKAARQVLEFAPPEPPVANTIEFEVKQPPVTPIVGSESIEAAIPKAARMPRGKETSLPPDVEPLPLPSVTHFDPPPVQPLSRPTFGKVVAIDIDAKIEVEAPSDPPASERPNSTLVYWTTSPIQITPVEVMTPARMTSSIPMVEQVEAENPEGPFISSGNVQGNRDRFSPSVRRYMDRLGSPDGTPRIVPRYPQNFPVRYSPPPRRHVDGVIHWAFSSGAAVRDTMLWPLRMLAEPFREFD